MKSNKYNEVMRYSGLGFRMMFIILFFVLAGRWLDGYMVLQKPWFTIAGALISVPLSLYSVLRDFMKRP